MSCLEATFTLTPLSPSYGDVSGNAALLYCLGADFWVYSPNDLSSLYASNRFFFDSSCAADPNLNYVQWNNLRKTQHLECIINLSAGYGGSNKQLAMIFGFAVQQTSGPKARVLVYSNAGLLQDQQLVYGDNQFLLEIESLDQQLVLYFIHAANQGSVAGGDWFFTGLSGYVV